MPPFNGINSVDDFDNYFPDFFPDFAVSTCDDKIAFSKTLCDSGAHFFPPSNQICMAFFVFVFRKS